MITQCVSQRNIPITSDLSSFLQFLQSPLMRLPCNCYCSPRTKYLKEPGPGVLDCEQAPIPCHLLLCLCSIQMVILTHPLTSDSYPHIPTIPCFFVKDASQPFKVSIVPFL